MQMRKKRSGQNFGLRLAGLLMVVAGGFGLKLLYRAVNLPPAHQATVREMIVVAASFLAVSGGSVLLVLGTHIFDPVNLSARWTDPPG